MPQFVVTSVSYCTKIHRHLHVTDYKHHKCNLNFIKPYFASPLMLFIKAWDLASILPMLSTFNHRKHLARPTHNHRIRCLELGCRVEDANERGLISHWCGDQLCQTRVGLTLGYAQGIYIFRILYIQISFSAGMFSCKMSNTSSVVFYGLVSWRFNFATYAFNLESYGGARIILEFGKICSNAFLIDVCEIGSRVEQNIFWDLMDAVREIMVIACIYVLGRGIGKWIGIYQFPCTIIYKP